ncbi:sigma-70 family RNA polymerase sigma factor [Periweissella cryptocerci]|nr:sigma-70 family RNA polymerase sigma factor [Periweissella cryptocerci]
MLDFEQMDTTTLVIALQHEHDELGFVELCNRFKPLFYRLHKKFYNLNFTVDELQQEMRLGLFDCLQKFKAVGYRQTFGAYLKRMLQHRLLDHWRHQQTQKAIFYRENCELLDAEHDHEYLQKRVFYSNLYQADNLLELRETLTEFGYCLNSELERTAYHDILSGRESANNDQKTLMQMSRARTRVRKKLEQYLK